MSSRTSAVCCSRPYALPQITKLYRDLATCGRGWPVFHAQSPLEQQGREDAVRELLRHALADTDITDVSGNPITFAPHDLRRIFVTDAVINGMPPHIAQLVVGHKDINTTMGYKAVYPEEAINGHRAFIARRRALRPTAECRQPTDEEWEDFLGHFERRKVALGTCGRAFSTPCIHEHSCFSELVVDLRRGQVVGSTDDRSVSFRHHVGVVEPVETRWSGDLTASLVEAQTPSEVFHAAALCIAEELAPEGFRWMKSRKSLERRDGAGRWERIVLQPSHWNRSGALVAFDVAQLIVRDARLADWRTANHLLTVVRQDAAVDALCQASGYDMVRVGFRNKVILTEAERRVDRLGALCDQVREIVVPWFVSTRDPARLVQAVPDALLGPFAFGLDLVEFLVSRNEREQARLLIERILACEPKQRDAFEEGRALAREGSQSRPQWHTPAALRWSAAVLDLM